jgi:hypothetical protein
VEFGDGFGLFGRCATSVLGFNGHPENAVRPRCFQPVAALAAVGLLALWWIQEPAASPDDRNAMIGTWTDEQGPPGNSVRFYYVARNIPGAPYATAYDGHVTLAHFLGHVNARGTWGYGTWDPLVLNLTVGRRSWYVAIRKLDDDRLLVRFGTDAEEIYRPGAVDHPDARVLTRVGREP